MKKLQNKFLHVVGMVSLLSLLGGCDLFKTVHKNEPKLLIVNVLSKELYDDCHIPGSIQVDFDKVMDVAKQWSKSTKVVVYCANYACTASASVARSLRAQGFDAYEYGAGMAGWLQAGLPVDGLAQSPYLRQTNEKPSEAQHDIQELTTQELEALIKGE